jgi:hypothetical protein
MAAERSRDVCVAITRQLRRGQVHFNPEAVGPRAMVAAVADAGFSAKVAEAADGFLRGAVCLASLSVLGGAARRGDGDGGCRRGASACVGSFIGGGGSGWLTDSTAPMRSPVMQASHVVGGQ